MSITNKDKFANAAQEIALGEPLALIEIETPEINVCRFKNGLTIRRGEEEEIKIDMIACLIGAGDKTSPLRTTNSRGENDAFENEVIGAHRYGKSSGTSQFAAYATEGKTLVRIDNNQFILIKDLNNGSYGVAMMKDNMLSSGEIQLPGTAPKPVQSFDRDFSPLLPTHSI
ncbi:MAG: hypothetical protein WBK55_04485 [Alphaproteobacteria bacterium]